MRRRELMGGALALLLALAGCGPARLAGTDLGGGPAPDFTLTDQDGRPVSLAGLRGRAVALTFLYSSCPDICPLVAAKLRGVREALGPQAERVALVAISVDPERDRPEQLRGYTAAVGLEGRWHFLTGERAALAPVWAAYGIAVLPGPGGTINHTDAVILIDREGRQRQLLRSDFATEELAATLRVLAR